MYTPTRDELIEMGFEENEYEGNIHSYDHGYLRYHVTQVDGKAHENGPHWDFGSWHVNIYPETREQIQTMIDIQKNS